MCLTGLKLTPDGRQSERIGDTLLAERSVFCEAIYQRMDLASSDFTRRLKEHPPLAVQPSIRLRMTHRSPETLLKLRLRL